MNSWRSGLTWLRFRLPAIRLTLIWAAVIACAWLLITGLSVERDARTAKEAAAALGVAIEHADSPGITHAFTDLAENLNSAHDRLHDPIWTVASKVPFLGRTPQALQALTETANRTLPCLTPAVDRIARTPASTQGFMSDPGVIRALADSVPCLSRAIPTVDSRLTRLNLHLVPGAVAQPVLRIRDLVTLAAPAVSQDGKVASLLPALLGYQGDRTWLLLLEQGAEARASGGYVGAVGIVHAHNGTLELRTLESNDALNAQPIVGYETIVADDERLNFYGDDLSRLSDLDLSPDFPLSARLARENYRQVSGIAPQGVIAMDEHALQELMRAAGPVRVVGTVVDAGNIVGYVARDVYSVFRTMPYEAAVAEKDRRLHIIMQHVFRHLTGSGGARLKALMAVARASVDGRVALWSADPADQRRIALSPLGRAVGRPGGPDIDTIAINGGGNKLDAYLQVSTDYQQRCHASGRAPELDIGVRLANSAPSAGLPSYATERNDIGDRNPKVQGTSRTMLFIHVPADSTLLASSVNAVLTEPFATGEDAGRTVYRFNVLLPSKHQVEIRLRLHLPERFNRRAVRFGIQPRLLPVEQTVSYLGGCGK